MPGAGRLRALPAARPGDCTVPGCSAQLLLLLLAAVCTEPALGRTDASAGIAEELARGRRERGGAPGWLPTARLLAQGNCSGASLAGAEGSVHRVCGCGVSRAPTWGCGSCGSWRRLAAPRISLRMLWGQLPHVAAAPKNLQPRGLAAGTKHCAASCSTRGAEHRSSTCEPRPSVLQTGKGTRSH